jgi:hypothetical protein
MVAPSAVSSATPSTSASSVQASDPVQQEKGSKVVEERGDSEVSPSSGWAGVSDENAGAGMGCEGELELSPEVADGLETEVDQAQHVRLLEEAQVCCAASVGR